MCEGRTGMKMVCCFLTGAAIGAGLALLFAPQSGQETRKKIREFSDKVSDDVKENVEKIGEKAKTIYEGTREKFKKKLDDRE
jgi:gas vesicle protein